MMTSTVMTNKPLQDVSHNIPSPLKSVTLPTKADLKRRPSPEISTPENTKAVQRRRLSSEEPERDDDLKDIFSISKLQQQQQQHLQIDKSRLVTETRLLGVLEFNTTESEQSIQAETATTTTTTTTTMTTTVAPSTESTVKETRSIHDSIYITRKHNQPLPHLQQFQFLSQRRPLIGFPARRAATTTPEPVPSSVVSEKEIKLAHQIEQLQLERQYSDWLHNIEVTSWRETVDFIELEKKFMVTN